MIKVFISPLMLEYQQEIADLTHQCIQSRYIAGVKEVVWTDEEPLGSGIWNYFATMAIPSGTTVIVQAVAIDSLGGVGTLSEWTTVP